MTGYAKDFYIDAGFLNADRTAAFPRLIELAQETATLHTLDVGFPPSFYIAAKRGWVIAKADCIINKLPDWGAVVTARTWHTSFKGFVGERAFEITQNGENVLSMQTIWLYSDLTKRRPIRPPKEETEAYGPTTEAAFVPDYTFERGEGEPYYTEAYTVRRSDIDINNHVNNAKYLYWLYNCLSPVETEHIKRLRINYKRECTLGQKLLISLYRRTGGIQAEITHDTDLTTQVYFEI